MLHIDDEPVPSLVKVAQTLYLLTAFPFVYIYYHIWQVRNSPVILWGVYLILSWVLTHALTGVLKPGPKISSHIRLGALYFTCFFLTLPGGMTSPLICSLLSVNVHALRYPATTQFFWALLVLLGYIICYFCPPFGKDLYAPYDKELSLCVLVTQVLSAIIEAFTLKALIKMRVKEEEKRRVRAEQYVAAKSEILSTIAHEMRTPLFNILGWAELMFSETSLPKHKNILSYILQSGEDLKTQINDTLDLSKMEAREIVFKKEQMDVKKCVKQACLGFPRVNIKVEYQLGHLDAREGFGDTQRIRQCLNNFISNAIKYTRNGRVLIKTQSHYMNTKNYNSLLSNEIQPVSAVTPSTPNSKQSQDPFFSKAQLQAFRKEKHIVVDLQKPNENEGMRPHLTSVGPSGGCHFLVITGAFIIRRSRDHEENPTFFMNQGYLVFMKFTCHFPSKKKIIDRWPMWQTSSRPIFLSPCSTLNRPPRELCVVTYNFSLDRGQKLLFMVEIWDTGPGISEEYLPKLFNAFFQISEVPTTLPNQASTGLGLYITKQLVKLMGGSISVSSIQDVGSIFAFTVPLDFQGSQLATKHTDSFSFTPPTLPVLVAEDNEVANQLVTNFLTRLNCKVISVRDGQEALDVALNQELGLIIMDYKMPNIDGLEFFQKMNAHKLNIPFILMSGSDESSTQFFYSEGISTVLLKPFSLNQLKCAMHQAFDTDGKKGVPFFRVTV